MHDKVRSLTRAIRGGGYDMLLVHQTGSDAPVIASRAGFHGPMVLIHHSTGLSVFCRQYDQIVFVSAGQEKEALRRYPQLKGRTTVIRYFASAEYYVPCDPAPRQEATFIGIMDTKRKGLDLLLEAYVRDPRLRSVTLNVIGDGPLQSRWKKVATDNNLPIRFHGRVSHAENAAIIGRSGAYVMPSRGEGLALVYLEALCMGVPIIGYPPNVREIETLLGRPVGFAFQADVDELSQLADHIVSLTSDNSAITRTDRREISESVRNRFSLKTFHLNYSRFLRQFEPRDK
jgi:glycosyltransferase involved in cell wall biosynthesis